MHRGLWSWKPILWWALLGLHPNCVSVWWLFRDFSRWLWVSSVLISVVIIIIMIIWQLLIFKGKPRNKLPPSIPWSWFPVGCYLLGNLFGLLLPPPASLLPSLFSSFASSVPHILSSDLRVHIAWRCTSTNSSLFEVVFAYGWKVELSGLLPSPQSISTNHLFELEDDVDDVPGGERKPTTCWLSKFSTPNFPVSFTYGADLTWQR